MNDNIKRKIPMFIIILILVVFAILFIVNETHLFDDEKHILLMKLLKNK